MPWSRQRLPVLLALAALAIVLVVNAWSCDDAFITFRTARNLWNGHGLTWNPGWRVQAYTHPLWMFLAAACYGITGECYFSVLALAIILSMGVGWALARAHAQYGPAAVVLLSASAAAIEFAVSGLENPLLFLLLVAFVAMRTEPLRAALIAAAIGLTRTDALLLVLPALALSYRAWRQLALGLLPLFAWHLFSLVYYGIPVPNTAIAKLNTHWSTGFLLEHGLAYLLESLCRDPLTSITIGASLSLLLRARSREGWAWALGIALYLGYIVRIGGDFMSGRFLGAPFVLAMAATLADARLPPAGKRWYVPALCGAIALFAIAWPSGPWRLQLDRGQGRSLDDVMEDAMSGLGIADERAFYFRRTGLIHMLIDRQAIAEAGLPLPPHEWAQAGADYARARASLAAHASIGFYGYFAGDKLVVDPHGLADPFLARIPECIEPIRIGHCLRAYPSGYFDSLVSGRNLIANRELAELYGRVHALAVEPLFSASRWRAISCLNLGACGRGD